MKIFFLTIILANIVLLGCNKTEDTVEEEKTTMIRLKENWNSNISGNKSLYAETYFLALTSDIHFFSSLSKEEILYYSKDSADWHIFGNFVEENSEGEKFTEYKNFDLPLGKYGYLFRLYCKNTGKWIFLYWLGGDDYQFYTNDPYLRSYEFEEYNIYMDGYFRIREGKNTISLLGPQVDYIPNVGWIIFSTPGIFITYEDD